MQTLLKRINPTSAAKLAVLILALVNQLLSMRGQGPLPITNDEINYYVSTTMTLVTAVLGYFDNERMLKDQDVKKVGSK